VTDIRDELLEQVVDELQTLPPMDEGAVARIVRAAAADARAPGSAPRPGNHVRAALSGWWRSNVPLAAAAGFAVAAGLAGFLAGDARHESTPVAFVNESAPESLRLAVLPSGRRPLPAMVPTQFVLDAPRASRVALVGDFNAWDASVTQLARPSANGIWTVTVPLSAGRHTYAFMIDDTVWTLDPRAPKTHDPDFGTASSVVLVGTP
jgi:hypothetical protein